MENRTDLIICITRYVYAGHYC